MEEIMPPHAHHHDEPPPRRLHHALPPDDDIARIQEVGEQVGVSPRMLRYWEQQGIIEPSRAPGGARHYNRHDQLMLMLIRAVLDEGYSVSDLRLLREAAEHEAEAIFSSDNAALLLQWLYRRKYAEPMLHELMERVIPPKRHH
jgi:DNA-binding transcriptional MerR regulator